MRLVEGSLWEFFEKDKIIVNKRLSSIKINQVFETFDKETKDKFVFFPLHFEPELVLLLQSQPFLNQLNVIQHITIARGRVSCSYR